MLCDDIDVMDAWYSRIFSNVPGMLPHSYELTSGKTMLRLRERTRPHDGPKQPPNAPYTRPGVQLTFLVPDAETVERCYEQLQALGVTIMEPPTDQPRGHRCAGPVLLGAAMCLFLRIKF